MQPLLLLTGLLMRDLCNLIITNVYPFSNFHLQSRRSRLAGGALAQETGGTWGAHELVGRILTLKI